MSANPQIVASDPEVSAFVTANAGSGKTRTLVDRVARLLLRGADPAAILCVTYTKAAAAEMQGRLFESLGAWAVMEDEALARTLAGIEERPRDLSRARTLFARALETPGGLKIQTIHAFCEKLLRRFPLEAGVSPNFRVLEDQAAREVSARARDAVAEAALQDPDGVIGRAYGRFAVELDHRSFQEMFAAFEARRGEIKAYVEACAEQDGVDADVWRRCGLEAPAAVETLEAEAVSGVDPDALRRAGRALLEGSAKTDAVLGAQVLALAERWTAEDPPAFADLWRLFCTKDGKPLSRLATSAVGAEARDWLAQAQARLGAACGRIRAAQVAEDTVAALTLATAYGELYGGAKDAQAGLDFADLIGRTHRLLTSADGAAAWVLFKLDGGLDHVLVDEAQDTAPDQWEIVDALTAEFFAGAGRRETTRTAFAVGDEKQSIFSFQGAEPERFLKEAENYRGMAQDAGRPFVRPSLLESWRSTPEVLSFVDAVFSDPEALKALRPPGAPAEPVVHIARRDAGLGSVELWPLEQSEPAPETDPWAPVDVEPPEGANKKLARRIARRIKAMVVNGEAVLDKESRRLRPMAFGDVLILVRRRRALFHEIIRALKREEVPVGGADRLTLSDHVVFHDLVSLARLCLYPWDDLTLAALLRSPLCDIDEDGLYALAQGRTGSLWGELQRRAAERPEWAAACDLFAWARAQAAQRTPFDFYGRLLARRDGAGRTIRARILTRLGREAEQALDAFLAEALAAERRGVRDLERFADQMAGSEVEVKREQEEGRGEVRVMTVHGSKGLEAPVVILPDTATRASSQGGPLIPAEGGGFLWCARKAEDCEASAAARQVRADAGDQESLRLLYVALTRARDRLIVCGVEPGRASLKERSWRDFVARAFARPPVSDEARELQDQDGVEICRYGAEPARLDPELARPPPPAAPPAWLGRAAPPEPPQLAFASPSRLAEAERGPAPSPLARVGGLGRFRRGELVHKLLQLLPDLDPAGRAAAAAAILGRERDLDPGQRREMAEAALQVLRDERFAAVFGPGSRAEVAVAGSAPSLPGGLRISGRVDRLVVEDARVLVVDYKTNRPSPDRIEDADDAYIVQMAVYAAVLAEAFPGRVVEAALVWTDGPKLMAVPENLMAEALRALPRSG
jgi:ATP-dependent helicase/nuclease subunit A